MVNTFIVSPDPYYCAQVLDNLRLNKQCTEIMQIVSAADGSKSGYRNHPVVTMWVHHLDALKTFFNICVAEWLGRGKNNNRPLYDVPADVSWPWWFGWSPIHYSHQASLLRKDPEHYSQYFLPNDNLPRYIALGYVWPTALYARYEHLTHNQVLDILITLTPEEMCSPIGTGAPIQYRISQASAQQWVTDPTKNPETGRAIKQDGPLYRDYYKAAEYYGLLDDV
jgi:hypothetical protein